jgi:pyruvate-formate lyase-activating enzyme
LSKTVIFYGAGSHAKAHMDRWISEGCVPACFADADADKQGKLFCGYKILSPSDAMKSYPDYEFHITLANENKLNCRNYLISQGIPSDRIKFAGTEGLNCRLGCDYLYEFISFSPFNVMTCPDQFFGERALFNVPYAGAVNLRDAIALNLKKRCAAIAALANNERAPCSGCENLRLGCYPAKPNIFRVSFCGVFKGERCNLSCCYCNAPKYGNVEVRLIDALKSIGEFFAGTRFNINFTTGEFFLRRDCDEVLEYCRSHDYLVNFTTNGTVYRDVISKLAENGNVEHMNISLDSGNPQTYLKIKGFDYFAQVVGNLEKYHSLHIPLVLKFIILEDMNDNIDDAEGFFRIARRLNATVALSNNQYAKEARLKGGAMSLLAALIRKCRQAGLKVILYRDFFNPDDACRLEKILNANS